MTSTIYHPKTHSENGNFIKNEEEKTVVEATDHKRNKSNFLQKALLLSLWYTFSFFTIVLNKYILTVLEGNAGLLGRTQMLLSVAIGGVVIYVLPCFQQRSNIEKSKMRFFKNMSILGILRFGTVVCSLISLKNVAVSFTETVKASAPLFTVIFSFIILREKVGLLVMLSLIPVMAGLSICSINEISFNEIGFVAAVINNIMDCIQNVFTKKLLSEESSYTPPQLQFFTGMAALLIQIPYWIYMTDFKESFKEIDSFYFGILILNSCSFYFQSLTAYRLMALISPLTFSVANTVKRTLLIWLSVVVFANHVTVLSGVGTMIVTFGVVFYQKAKQMEAAEKQEQSSLNESSSDHLHP